MELPNFDKNNTKNNQHSNVRFSPILKPFLQCSNKKELDNMLMQYHQMNNLIEDIIIDFEKEEEDWIDFNVDKTIVFDAKLKYILIDRLNDLYIVQYYFNEKEPRNKNEVKYWLCEEMEEITGSIEISEQKDNNTIAVRYKARYEVDEELSENYYAKLDDEYNSLNQDPNGEFDQDQYQNFYDQEIDE